MNRCWKDTRGFEWRYLRQAADQSALVTHQLQGLRPLRPGGNGGNGPRLVLIGGTLYNGTIYNSRQQREELLAWDTTSWAPIPLNFITTQSAERWWWYPAKQAALAVRANGRTFAVHRLPNLEEVAVIGPDGIFYGTTAQGGSGGGYGTVFKITPDGVFDVLASASPPPLTRRFGLCAGNQRNRLHLGLFSSPADRTFGPPPHKSANQ